MSYTTINGKLVGSNQSKRRLDGAGYVMPKLEREKKRIVHNRAALALIRCNSGAFTFYHNNLTDGREVYDMNDQLVLTIDHSLRFIDPVGRQVGHIQSERGMWVFHNEEHDEQFETMFSVNTATRDYCWEQLERAEIASIKSFLNILHP